MEVSKLNEIVEAAINRILTEKLSKQEDVLLEYYAEKLRDYRNNIASKLNAIFHNLACICIFHKVHTYTLNHWKNQAKNLLNREFEIKVKQGDKKTAISLAFEDAFGSNYEDITPKWFLSDILYYKNKEKRKQILVKENEQYFFQTYIKDIVSILDILKKALIEEDIQLWDDSVDKFYQTILEK